MAIALAPTQALSAADGRCVVCGTPSCRRVAEDSVGACMLDPHRRTMDKGEYLAGPNHPVQEDPVLLIVSGMALVQSELDDGRRQVCAFLVPGDILFPMDQGDGALVPWVGAHGGDLSVIAASSGEICRLSRARVIKMARHVPGLMERLFERARLDMARAADHMLLLSRLNAAERVVAFLLRMADRQGHPPRDGVEVALPMSREDIADHLGLTVETVCRRFSDLRKRGLIALPRPTVAVLTRTDDLISMLPYRPYPPDQIGETHRASA